MSESRFLRAATILCLLLINTAFATRTFGAASKNIRLRRRDASFEPRLQGNTLFYAEESECGIPPSAVRLSLKPMLPTLIHEDVLDHIAISCHPGSISVSFHNSDVMLNARDAWNQSEFLLVTSQYGCGTQGHHTAYVVNYASSSETTHTIILKAVEAPLRSKMHDIYVEIGSHLVLELDTMPQVVKRQATVTATSSIPPATNIVSTNISFVAPAPTATGSSDVRKDISFSQVDKVILPPPAEIMALIPNPKIFENIGMRCANCSMRGMLELEVAGFSLQDADGEANSAMEIAFDFTQDGFFEFTANGIEGTFEFDISLQPGFSLDVFEVPLPQIPLTPLVIPGVIVFGPVLAPVIPVKITLNNPVTFTTGFTLTVPDNSKIYLNVSEVAASYTSGFSSSKIEPVPFNIDAKDLSFSLSTAFRPELLLAAGVGSQLTAQVEGGIGVFLDIPELVANITVLTNQNATCNGPSPSGETNTRINIDYSANLNAGARFELTIDLPALPSYVRELTKPFGNLSIPITSQCLLWSSEQNGLVQPPSNQNKQNAAAGVYRASGLSVAMIVIALSSFTL